MQNGVPCRRHTIWVQPPITPFTTRQVLQPSFQEMQFAGMLGTPMLKPPSSSAPEPSESKDAVEMMRESMMSRLWLCRRRLLPCCCCLLLLVAGSW